MVELPADSKLCPDCGETVRKLARKCRFCGFEFAKSPLVAPDGTELAPAASPGGAPTHEVSVADVEADYRYDPPGEDPDAESSVFPPLEEDAQPPPTAAQKAELGGMSDLPDLRDDDDDDDDDDEADADLDAAGHDAAETTAAKAARRRVRQSNLAPVTESRSAPEGPPLPRGVERGAGPHPAEADVAPEPVLITFACLKCGKAYKLRTVSFAGRRMRCKACGQIMIVPYPEGHESQPKVPPLLPEQSGVRPLASVPQDEDVDTVQIDRGELDAFSKAENTRRDAAAAARRIQTPPADSNTTPLPPSP